MPNKLLDLAAKFDLSGANNQALVDAGKIIGPHLDSLLEDFYEGLKGNGIAEAFFPDPGRMKHARAAQKKHWQMLLTGKFSADYAASAQRVGHVHFKIQLPFELYLSSYSRTTARIHEVILANSGAILGRSSRNKVSAMLGALTNAFSLDMYLVIDAYFEAQTAEQTKAFDFINEGIDRMAAKDLSKDIPSPEESDFPTRYDAVRVSFNEMMQTNRVILKTIKDAALNLSQHAEEVLGASEDLAERSETQANALAETSAAVQQINDTVRGAAEATAKTEALVAESQENADVGNSYSVQCVEKMSDISKSSTQISEVIGVIESIAFQTNLLALNAGVEAARAGEAGSGFAVVASEVRSLAQRATESAQEITEIVNSSVGDVKTGVQLVDQASEALRNISTGIGTARELTSNVASSTREQSSSLEEIASSVTRLDGVTQQNVAMVEETTAAILSMRHETQTLSQLVESFVIDRQ